MNNLLLVNISILLFFANISCNNNSNVKPLSLNKQKMNASQVPEYKNPIKIIYFTDPICSACWGIEPQLRRLKLEYGTLINIEYRMGGLLPDWSYNAGGISKPSDVSHHWDEVSPYYDMPIDGDIWLEDPLASSYPPSIAFKAAQLQDEEKSILFLRELREMVFLKKKNICKWENLEIAAYKVGLNSSQLKIDIEGKAKELFNEDLKLGSQLSVQGFPTLFIVDSNSKNQLIYGAKTYSEIEKAILKFYPKISKLNYEKSWSYLFSKFSSLTAREYAELADIPRNQAELKLDELVNQAKLTKLNTKNGAIWYMKD